MNVRGQPAAIRRHLATQPAGWRWAIVAGTISAAFCFLWIAQPCLAKPALDRARQPSARDAWAWPASIAVASAAEIERGREALSREGFPWYDAAQDAVRPVRVKPPKPAPAASQSGSRRNPAWPQGISWLAISVVFGVAMILLARAYLNREKLPAGGVREPAKIAAANEATRIEALPFRIRPADHDLLEEARRQYESGHYEAAIVYLFSYQLVEMDKHQVLRLTKGKTNRQYLRDLRRQPRLSRLVEHSMIAFEEVFFGDRRLAREAFESRWHALDEFHSLVRRQVAT